MVTFIFWFFIVVLLLLGFVIWLVIFLGKARSYQQDEFKEKPLIDEHEIARYNASPHRRLISTSTQTPNQANFEESQKVNAYWQVMNDLVDQDDKALDHVLLESFRVPILNAVNDPQKTGRMLRDSLSHLNWHHRAWEKQADQYDENSLNTVRTEVKAMTKIDLMSRANKNEMNSLVIRFGGKPPKRSTIKDLCEWLEENANSADLHDGLEEIRMRVLHDLLRSNRTQIAAWIVSRIGVIIHRQKIRNDRLDCLNNPAYLKIKPNCQFRCDSDHPSVDTECMKFNGQVMPLRDALLHFPKLPCPSIKCGGDLIPHGTQN